MVAVEVKEFDLNSEERDQLKHLEEEHWFHLKRIKADSRVRSKIGRAEKQLRIKAKGHCPAVLVLYNADPLRHYLTSAHAIKTAMYGSHMAIFRVSQDDPNELPFLLDRRFGGSRMMTPDANTSVSAIAVFDGNELTIYHNVHAAFPLRPELFRGMARQYTLAVETPGDFTPWQEII